MTTHWGEYDTPEVPNEEVIPAEIVKLFLIKAMQEDPFRTPLPVGGPVQEDTSELGLDLLSSETNGLEMDDRVLHTIKLLQHAKEMGQLIEAAKEQTEVMADSQFNRPTFPPAMDIPEYPLSSSSCRINYPMQYMDKEFSDFTTGAPQHIPEVTTQTARLLLKKSVAALLAHSGFDTTSSNVLSTVTDIAEDYIKKMTHLLRIAVDQGANVMATGFPDAVERVFHEMNIGSVRCLHDYYQKRIIKYQDKMLEECRALNNEYNNISIPIKSESFAMETITKLEEPDDVPQIHFPALDDGDGVDELQPSLEPGFQMLHNLEHSLHSPRD